jgi:hypothetical protein
MLRFLFALIASAAICTPIRLHAHGTSVPSASTQLAQEREEDRASACQRDPTRRCVADLALAAVMSIEDPMWREASLSRLAEVYARMGDVAPMVEAVAKIGTAQYQVHLIAELAFVTSKIDGTVARRAFQSAIDIADAMQDPASRVGAYGLIADRAIAAGDLDTTRKIVDAERSAARLSPALLTNIGFARTQAAIGDVAQSLATVEKMADNDIDIETMTQIAEIQAAVGETGSASDTIMKALALAKRIEPNSYDHEGRHGVVQGTAVQSCAATIGNRDFALGKISTSQARIGDTKAALLTANRIEDVYWRAELLGQIAEWQTEQASLGAIRSILRAALAAAGQVEAGECRHAVMSTIAVAQAKAGDFAGALATAAANDETDPGSMTIVQIVEAWAKAGRAAPAAGTASARFRAQTLAAIARQKAESGDAQAARDGVDATLALLNEVKDLESRALVLTRIAGIEALLGDVAAVRRFMQAAADEGHDAAGARRRLTTAVLIAAAQAKSGQVVDALATANTLDDPWARADTLLEIADAMSN